MKLTPTLCGVRTVERVREALIADVETRRAQIAEHSTYGVPDD